MKSIELIEKQPGIARNADELYKSKRFVGIVLSTGGGKSFLAMDQIIKRANEYNADPKHKTEGPYELSRCPMLYFSPTNIINAQFRTHMAKYIIAPEYLEMDKQENGAVTESSAPQVLTRLMAKLNLEGPTQEMLFKLNSLIYNRNNSLTPEEAVNEILREELEKAPTDLKTGIVKKAFPNLHFKAYKNLEKVNSKSDEYEETIDEEEQEVITDINKIKPEFIIFDEAHRTGAKTWWPKIEAYIGKNKTTKILAITATPERDVDEQNMMKRLAAIKGMGYSIREQREKKYLAGDYPLMKAIEEGMVTPPDIIHFNMTLDESSEFKKMLRAFVTGTITDFKTPTSNTQSYYNMKNKVGAIEKAFSDMLVSIRTNPLTDDIEETKAKVEGVWSNSFTRSSGVMTRLRDVIKYQYFELGRGRTPEDIDEITGICEKFLQDDEWEPGKSWNTVKKERVSEIITSELAKRGLTSGKALTFIDSMPAGPKGESNQEKRSRARIFIDEQIKIIKGRLGLIAGVEPDVSAIHSTAFTEKENDRIVDDFMAAPNDSGPFKIIASVNKFNEGFHADGVNAAFMVKEIAENAQKGEPRIVLLQQLGRVISAGSKDKTVVFDLANNFMRNHDKFMQEVSQDKDCFNFLQMTKYEKSFQNAVELIEQNTPGKKRTDYHVDETISILSVLMKRIIDPNGATLKCTLNEFIDKIQNDELREQILDELYVVGIELENHGDINIGQGLKHLKDVAWNVGGRSDSKALKALSNLSIQELKNLGILDLSEKGIAELRRLGGRVINDSKFIVGGNLPNLYRLNALTGTYYDGPENSSTTVDYYGCRPDGYDPAGYDRYGFNRAGIHKVTGMPYDERMFTRTADGKWINLLQEPGSERESVDLLGYNIDGINPKTGFDRDGFWHKKLKDGSFAEERSVYSDRKLDVHDFTAQGHYYGQKNIYTNNGLFSNGTRHPNPKTRQEWEDIYGINDRDIDGFNRNGFNINGVHRITGTHYDTRGYDFTGVNTDPALREAISQLNYIRRKGVSGVRGKTPEELGEIIAKGISASRVYYDIEKDSPMNIAKILREFPDYRLKEVLDLPTGINGRTIRDMKDEFVLASKAMSEHYTEKLKFSRAKNPELAKKLEELEQLVLIPKFFVKDAIAHRNNNGSKDFVR